MGHHEFSREERIRMARLHRKCMNKINRRKVQKAKCREDLILKRIDAKEHGDGTLWTTKEVRMRERARLVLQTGNAAIAKVVPRYYLKELCQLEDPSGGHG